MGLAKHDDMVGALAASGSNQPFGDAVGCPLFVVGASRRCHRPDRTGHLVNAHPATPLCTGFDLEGANCNITAQPVLGGLHRRQPLDILPNELLSPP
jgi:hypothetical protein